MDKFREIAYKRPDVEQYKQEFKVLLEEFSSSQSSEEQLKTVYKIDEFRRNLSTMRTLAHIRHTLDTSDSFYDEEHRFYDQTSPELSVFNHQFYKALIATPFRMDLEKELGTMIFKIAENSIRVFDEKIIEELQKENELISSYVKIQATADFEFNGEHHNLSTIQKFEISSDRKTRRSASAIKWEYFQSKENEIAEIYDSLVKCRTAMAQKLGFANFIEMGYSRMMRTDYDEMDVAKFRDFIAQKVVPLTSRIYKRQEKIIDVSELKFYDESYLFTEGNPQPLGDEEWIIGQAEVMYQHLSSETAEFFQLMKEAGLMDLKAKKNKATGGYCTFLESQGLPFIFSNFNGTSGDMDVLTHEAGHAFQVYQSRASKLSEYLWPSFEACEIHSMSMEFFTWPWMELFFGERANDYRYLHLSSALKFLPYGAAIDEFQHYVYSNPNCGHEKRIEFWKAMEKKYLPHRDYDGLSFLEKGSFWMRQTHLFSVPFYYIDYALAQICAFQFWKADRVNHQAAWINYLKICKMGGSQPFLTIVREGGLQSPFDIKAFDESVMEINSWLNEFQH